VHRRPGGHNTPYNMAKLVIEYSRQLKRECLQDNSLQDPKGANDARKKVKTGGKS
jgi:hypothetical protein